MLAFHGWCVIRTSREAYTAATIDNVDAVDDAVDIADRQLWADFRTWMQVNESPFLKWQLHEQLNNHSGMLTFCGSRNHRAAILWDMLQWITANGVGSFGLVYVHDDEDSATNTSYGRGNADFTNVFRVHRILNGTVDELEDPFFGDIVPTINPCELA